MEISWSPSTSSLPPSIPKNLSTAIHTPSSFTETTLQIWPYIHFLLLFQTSDFFFFFKSTSVIYPFFTVVFPLIYKNLKPQVTTILKVKGPEKPQCS